MQKIIGLIASRIWPLLWRYRHLWDRDWSLDYGNEDSLDHSHRQLILEAVSRYEPIESVFEIGCGAGANLFRLSEKYPEIYLRGYDISKSAVATARTQLGGLPNNVVIYDDVEGLNYPFSIVVIDAVSIYVSDKNIKSFIDRFKKLAKKAFVLCEWHSSGGDSFIYQGHWVHNYEKLLPGCKITNLTQEDWPESRNWQKYGSIITYETS